MQIEWWGKQGGNSPERKEKGQRWSREAVVVGNGTGRSNQEKVPGVKCDSKGLRGGRSSNLGGH